MPDGLEVENIQISPPRLAEPDMETGEQEQFFDVAITVRNRSQETLHAISEVRRLGYDSGTRTLSLGLSEPEPDPEVPLDHLFPPALTAVPPGDSVVLRVSVPLLIKRLTREFDLEEIDISNLERVDCTVGYSDTPFEPDIVPSEDQPPGEQMRQQVRSWEQTVEASQAPERSAE